MKCEQCYHTETKVLESRESADSQAIRRRRECLQCAYRFTTYERIEKPQLIVVKHGGTRELYGRDKLLAGLYRACEKTSVSSLQLERLVSDIEKQLYSCGEPEVSSTKIGELAMEHLLTLNEVAYVRFASVYRRFKDIAGFESELKHIKHKQRNS